MKDDEIRKAFEKHIDIYCNKCILDGRNGITCIRQKHQVDHCFDENSYEEFCMIYKSRDKEIEELTEKLTDYKSEFKRVDREKDDLLIEISKRDKKLKVAADVIKESVDYLNGVGIGNSIGEGSKLHRKMESALSNKNGTGTGKPGNVSDEIFKSWNSHKDNTNWFEVENADDAIDTAFAWYGSGYIACSKSRDKEIERLKESIEHHKESIEHHKESIEHHKELTDSYRNLWFEREVENPIVKENVELTEKLNIAVDTLIKSKKMIDPIFEEYHKNISNIISTITNKGEEEK